MNIFLVYIVPVLTAGSVLMYFHHRQLFPKLDYPLDFGLTWRGNRLFGDNKTALGPIIMITVGGLTAVLVGQLPQLVQNLELGMLLGLGYSLGELPNSFIKRQLSVAPGEHLSHAGRYLFYVIDQTDSALMVSLLLFIRYHFNGHLVLTIFLLGVAVHLCFDWLMYLIGYKQTIWLAEQVPVWLISVCLTVIYCLSKVLLIYPGINRAKLATNRRGIIIAANHQHLLDPIYFLASLSWSDFKALLPLRFITHDRYLDVLWKKICLYPLGCFPAEGTFDQPGHLLAKQFLLMNQTIFIFPEGKIVADDSSPSVKVGVAYLAQRTRHLILLVNICANKTFKYVTVNNRLYQDSIPTDRSANLEPVARAILNAIYDLSKRT